jgi:hypothetical protein
MIDLLQIIQVDASEAIFASFTLGMLIWLSVMMNNLYAENLRQRYRIMHLSNSLQMAEYQTGKPYYTGISLAPVECESSLLEIYLRADAAQGKRKRSASI